MAGSDRGASETLGAILMTVVAVVAVSVAAGAMFVADAPAERPQAKIDATATDGTLTVTHVGGEPLDSEAVEVVLGASGVSVTPEQAIDANLDGDGYFEPGEWWRFSLDGSAPADVSLVYHGESAVVVDEAAVQEGSAPEATTTTTTTEKPTTSPSGDGAEDEGDEREDGEPGGTTTSEDTDYSIETFQVNEHRGQPGVVRFEVVYRIEGEYDSVDFGLYRLEDGEWTLVDSDGEDGGRDVWDWWDWRVIEDVILEDSHHDSGEYRVVMWVSGDGETETRYTELTVEAPPGRGNGPDGDGADLGGWRDWIDRWEDWWSRWTGF
ncbi:MAG: type IV pilin [Halanaeroarchaeum sp.]